MVYYREKMVDRDDLCPINVMSNHHCANPVSSFTSIVVATKSSLVVGNKENLVSFVVTLSKNDKSNYICSMTLKRFYEEYGKYGTLSIYS